ncbi:lactosylceramide 4-alpha-galactosyltransferase-like [Daphnia pulex]|uniref:lactosylceramide 4-alpha-galactosyltransferase-like n=1 Tax=Daphnia pulex TaxID=6669 RepID=UPI001EE01320|nr:lactosylceramide 4-alpha-galactosyltransferase-like [Daphnia pulex]XP_046448097.1 lactosylceramide 4-alpha-galactosyltransferase-like [Daphnia pulex]
MASLCNSVGVHFWTILSSLNSKRFRLGYFVITCFLIYWIYSAIVSNQQVVSVWLNFVQTRKFDPLMASNRKIDRRTCCQSPDYSKDICGRPNCTSCPSPRDLNQLKSDGQNAFFIETSGSGALNIRQAFAVESLAFHNPNLTINVLFMDDGHKKQIKKSKVLTETVEKLKSKYENIQFIVVDLDEFMAGTSMDKWFHCTDWRTGPYHVAHLSDGLRFLTLHKYGGYYFDLDIISVRPVTYYRNFITAASATNFANGIIHADYGHPITQLAVNDFPTNYKKNMWTHNGPDLVLRVMKIFCQEENFNAINYVSCRGFGVLPTSTFSPIHWSNWQSFFSQRPANETGAPSWITNQVVGVHVWNKLSFNETAYKNSTQEYVLLVSHNCPVIYSIAPETF